MVQTFTLQNQLNDLAMYMHPLNLDDPHIYFDDCLDEEDMEALGMISIKHDSIVEEEQEAIKGEGEASIDPKALKTSANEAGGGNSHKPGSKAFSSFAWYCAATYFSITR